MKRLLVQVWPRLVPLTLAAVFVVASSQPSEAYIRCAGELFDCYQTAAAVDSFWYRFAAGIDCELAFVQCARIAIIGA
jgi:hypothetical protein